LAAAFIVTPNIKRRHFAFTGFAESSWNFPEYNSNPIFPDTEHQQWISPMRVKSSETSPMGRKH
jgi:hypothetical protein